MKPKKSYQAPKLEKIQLSISNAILAVCHQSPTYLSPISEFGGCNLTPGCYSGPGGPLPSGG